MPETDSSSLPARPPALGGGPPIVEPPVPIDEIAVGAGFTPSQAGALLTLLELKGAVRDAGGQHYVRS